MLPARIFCLSPIVLSPAFDLVLAVARLASQGGANEGIRRYIDYFVSRNRDVASYVSFVQRDYALVVAAASGLGGSGGAGRS